jgi:hypothetical protein
MVRVAFAVLISVVLAHSGAIAACPSASSNPPKNHPTKARAQTDNCVNLSAVPQISANVVAAEPRPTPKTPSYVEPTSAPYEGPTLGMAKPDPGVRPVPTVGYHWSLE